MVSAVNSANGVTIQDYEVLGEEEIERMFSEDAETAARWRPWPLVWRGACPSRHADWIHLGLHWVDAIQCTKDGINFGTDSQFATAAVMRLWHVDGTYAARRLSAVRSISALKSENIDR